MLCLVHPHKVHRLMWCTAQVWDARKFKVPLHVWEGLPANFETTQVPLRLAPRHTLLCCSRQSWKWVCDITRQYPH